MVGGNGEGKTSILESIYYLCTTKSFNARSDNEVVKFGEEDFEIDGLFNTGQGKGYIFPARKQEKLYSE